MNPRTGRPPKNDVSRDKRMNIRLTEQELESINFVADALNISKSEAIIRAVEMLRASIENK